MYDWALIRINSFRRPYSLCWNTQRSLGWVCLTDNSLISTNVHTHIHKIERELEWNPPEFFFCAVHKCWLWQFAYDDVTNDGSFYQIHKSIYDKNTKAIITDDWKRNLWCKKVMIRWLFFPYENENFNRSHAQIYALHKISTFFPISSIAFDCIRFEMINYWLLITLSIHPTHVSNSIERWIPGRIISSVVCLVNHKLWLNDADADDDGNRVFYDNPQ